MSQDRWARPYVVYRTPDETGVELACGVEAWTRWVTENDVIPRTPGLPLEIDAQKFRPYRDWGPLLRQSRDMEVTQDADNVASFIADNTRDPRTLTPGGIPAGYHASVSAWLEGRLELKSAPGPSR